MNTVAQRAVRAPAMTEARSQERFYVIMAAVCVLVAFLGFAPTYWAPLASGTFHAAPIVHLHGMLFFTWTLLFLAQTMLAGSGRLVRHRELGVAGVALGTAMVGSGLLVTIHSLKTQLAAGFGDAARAFALLPFSGALLFAVLLAPALLYYRRGQTHKRLMVLATISLLQPAIARWFLWLLAPPGASGPPPVAVSIAPGLLSDLLILAAVLYDWRTRGRPHRVYLIGGACIVAVQVLRIPFSTTAMWLDFADVLAAFSL